MQQRTVFRCALKVVMIAELFITGDRVTDQNGYCHVYLLIAVYLGCLHCTASACIIPLINIEFDSKVVTTSGNIHRTKYFFQRIYNSSHKHLPVKVEFNADY